MAEQEEKWRRARSEASERLGGLSKSGSRLSNGGSERRSGGSGRRSGLTSRKDGLMTSGWNSLNSNSNFPINHGVYITAGPPFHIPHEPSLFMFY